ncbi:hypothetical protein B0H63DRAFT_557362 [Podospora didyma]|uniref:SYO1-like TPR repeats domain-containing protein n=1 Tax=Podospora didyma TaxID=330526 RepID=A0AAE0U475_9PEZI|nr:hypothetical protein B0H63DRAFT_557362 [Podospora didyma]
MGKARRGNKANGLRTDPIAKPVKLPADPELAALRESKILPIINDLKSFDVKQRTSAAGAIANIVQDDKCRKLLLREQVVPLVLTETLTDASPDSRAAGWEILKVLAQEEEEDFCVHLYRLDILTAIEHAAKTIIETLSSAEAPFTKLNKAQQRLVWEISGSLLALLGFLAVARDEIGDAIVGNQIMLRFLFRLVAADSIPQEIFEETLSCLLTLTEENLEVGQALIDDQETRCYDALLKFRTGGGPKAVLACGVLHNVFTSLQWLDHSPGKDGACDAILVPCLSRALEQVASPGMSNGDDANLGIAQLALEILASIGTDLANTLEKGNRPQIGGKAGEEWAGIEDVDPAEGLGPDEEMMDVDGEISELDDDEVAEEDKDGEDEDGSDDDDDELDEDMDKVTGVDEDGPDAAELGDLPTLRELIQKTVPQLIRLSSNTVIEDEDAMGIQFLALSALNNLSWTISIIDFAEGENAHIYNAWAPAATKIWTKTIKSIIEADNADLALATQVTSLAWAISRSLNGNTPMDGNPHQKFMALYQASKGLTDSQEPCDCACDASDPLQSLGVKCIGVLGSLARHPAPIEINREIGVFLISRLSNADDVPPPADIIEMLNQIFDIYADEEHPSDKEVFWKDGFVKHLEGVLPRLKVIAKSIDKRQFEELRKKADEAVLNLSRFITYKKKHVPK